MRRDRTSIVVAHRLSTIYAADQIVVLDGGRVVDTGKHDELVERSGLYQRLYEMQFGRGDSAEETEVGRPAGTSSPPAGGPGDGPRAT